MIHSILRLLKNPFTLVFAAVTGGYGLYNRWLLLQVYGPSFKTGFWEMVTTVTTDPQYIAFVVLPAWLIVSVSNARRESTTPRLLRHGSRTRAWAYGWRNALKRPGFGGGSQFTEDESYGSTEEVPGRVA